MDLWIDPVKFIAKYLPNGTSLLDGFDCELSLGLFEIKFIVNGTVLQNGFTVNSVISVSIVQDDIILFTMLSKSNRIYTFQFISNYAKDIHNTIRFLRQTVVKEDENIQCPNIKILNPSSETIEDMRVEVFIRMTPNTESPILHHYPELFRLLQQERARIRESLEVPSDRNRASRRSIRQSIKMNTQMMNNLCPLDENEKDSDSISIKSTKSKDFSDSQQVKTCDLPIESQIVRKMDKAGSLVITSGTLDGLIYRLTNCDDEELTNIWMLTYRCYLSASDLIGHFSEMFNNPKNPLTTKQKIVNLLKIMIERHFFDFDEEESFNACSKFLDELEQNGNKLVVIQMRKSLDFRLRLSKSFHFDIDARKVENADVEHVLIELSSNNIIAMSASTLAQQLTIVDFELLKQLESDMFTQFLWGKDKEDTYLIHLNRYIEHFNRVGFWIGACICSYKDHYDRGRAIAKFVKVMKTCFDHQDFNTAMAILSGLGTSPVSRLKKSWEAAGKGKVAVFEAMQTQAFACSGNFRNYRELLTKTKPPLIPFFGLFIKDLTFMNDGNPKYCDDGLINFDKLRSISTLIHNFCQYKEFDFGFQRVEPIYTYCKNLPCLPESDLLALSYELEPRK